MHRNGFARPPAESPLLWLFLVPLLLLSAPARAEDPVHRAYSETEIRAMANARAILRTRFGDISIRFFPERAPNHVDNFLKLARSGFYDGTTFHRVISGFMIQGGDPETRNEDRSRHGTGGPGHRLRAEFSDAPHRRGTLSMARSAHPDSAGSQFFICVADAPHLDGQYTVFGEVEDGMEAVDRIAARPRDRRDNPKDRVEMRVEIRTPHPKTDPKTESPASDSADSPPTPADGANGS